MRACLQYCYNILILSNWHHPCAMPLCAQNVVGQVESFEMLNVNSKCSRIIDPHHVHHCIRNSQLCKYELLEEFIIIITIIIIAIITIIIIITIMIVITVITVIIRLLSNGTIVINCCHYHHEMFAWSKL